MTTFAAITTTRSADFGTYPASFRVEDGNGRTAEYPQPEPDLGLGAVEQHRQALRHFLGDQAHFAHIYTPGYVMYRGENFRRIVWVRPNEEAR